MIINHDISIKIKKLKQKYITLFLYDYELNSYNKVSILKINIYKDNNDELDFSFKRKNKYDLKSQIITYINNIFNIELSRDDIKYIYRNNNQLFFSIYFHKKINYNTKTILYILPDYNDNLCVKSNIIHNYQNNILSLVDKFELKDIII